ncbi:NB-ARC domain-containing protein [Micromonospora chokoriensis]
MALHVVRSRLARWIGNHVPFVAAVVGCLLAVAALITLAKISGSGAVETASWVVTVVMLPISVLAWWFGSGGRSRPGARTDRLAALPAPLFRIIDRPRTQAAVEAALTQPPVGPAGVVVALVGGGGFGKTTIAVQVCRLAGIERQIPGGVLWTTLGEETTGPALADRLNDLCAAVSGERPSLSDPEQAGFRLADLLAGRPTTLLVVDDIWRSSQLRPFLTAAARGTRLLITTRDRSTVPATGTHILVDAMTTGEALNVLGTGLGQQIAGPVAESLVRHTGRWPVLLALVNGALQRIVGEGLPVADAAEAVVRRLHEHGPTGFDLRRPEERREAVRTTMAASLSLLREADLERYWDLAIFAEDTDIPMTLLRQWWSMAYQVPASTAERLVDDFQRLSLLALLRRDNGATAIRLHDVIRDFARRRCGDDGLVARNRSLLDAVAVTPWWRLPDNAEYLWSNLTYHLAEAGRAGELRGLTADLCWVTARIERGGGPAGAQTDLARAGTTAAAELARILARSAPLLSPLKPSITDTLTAHLTPGPALAAFLSTYDRPRLVPRWPLPDLPPAATRRTIDGHRTWLRACTVSPDGRTLATAGDDDTVRLFDLASGRSLRVLAGHTAPVRGCAFMPSGRRILSASDDTTLRIWDGSTGEELARLSGHEGRVRGCAVAPDGTWAVSAGDDGTLRMWDLDTAECRAVLRGHDGPVRACAIDPTGRLIVSSGDDATVRVWAAAGGESVHRLTEHRDWVNACAVSADGAWIASVSDDMTLRLWNLSTGEIRFTVDGFTDWVYSCAVAPDGRFVASGSADGRVWLHDARTGRLLGTLQGHAAGVRGIAFAGAGSMVTAGDDGMIQIWDTEKLPGAREEARLAAGGNVAGNACAASPDGRWLLIGGDDATARRWPLDGTGHPQDVTVHGDWVRGCDWAQDGRTLASCADDGTVVVCDTAGDVVRTFEVPGVWHLDCALTPDGRSVASAGNDGVVRVWEVASGERTALLRGHVGWVNACEFSVDGRLLASAGNDGVVRVWDVSSGALVAALTGHTGAVNSCSLSADGRLLTAVGQDRTVRVWELATRRNIASLRVAGVLRDCVWVPHQREPLICAVGAGGVYLFALTAFAP